MALIAESEDLEIRRLLGGNEGELAQGFERLERTYGERFRQILRKRRPGLNPEDVADAWQDTLKDLLEALREGRLRLEAKLFPWLWTVLHRRIYDQAEGMEKRRRIREHVEERLRGTRVGEAVEELGPARRSVLLARVREAVEGLSPTQRGAGGLPGRVSADGGAGGAAAEGVGALRPAVEPAGGDLRDVARAGPGEGAPGGRGGRRGRRAGWTRRRMLRRGRWRR